MLLKLSIIIMVMTLVFTTPFSLAEQDSITVVSEEWPPYNYTNKKGRFTGIATKILEEVLTEANINYDIEVYSWNRAYVMARDNKNTLLYTVYRIGNRIDEFQWICPLVHTRGVAIYAMADRDDITLDTLNDAKKFLTGTVSTGVSYDLLIHAGFKYGEHFDIASDDYANIRKLTKQRIDLIIQEVEPLKLRMQKLGLASSIVKKVYTVIPDDGQIGCMAFSLDTSKELIERIKKALIRVKDKHSANNH